MEETPKQKPLQKPLPEDIKNSIYVHPFTNDSDDLPKILIDKLPEGYSFLRLSSTHSHLTIVTKQQNTSPKITKNTVPVLSEMVGKTLFVSIFMKVDTVFPNLTQFSKNRNLVLNLVQDITFEDKQAIRNSHELRVKINQDNVLNNSDFYDKYINKPDKIEFPTLSTIKPVVGDFYLLCFKNETCALISKNQLLAAMAFNPALQKTSNPISPNQTTEPDESKIPISNLINHTLLPPQNIKRKFEGNNLNENEITKHIKSDENNITANKDNTENHILEDSKSPTFS